MMKEEYLVPLCLIMGRNFGKVDRMRAPYLATSLSLSLSFLPLVG